MGMCACFLSRFSFLMAENRIFMIVVAQGQHEHFLSFSLSTFIFYNVSFMTFAVFFTAFSLRESFLISYYCLYTFYTQSIALFSAFGSSWVSSCKKGDNFASLAFPLYTFLSYFLGGSYIRHKNTLEVPQAQFCLLPCYNNNTPFCLLQQSTTCVFTCVCLRPPPLVLFLLVWISPPFLCIFLSSLFSCYKHTHVHCSSVCAASAEG